jgi:hypothetical protein
MCTVALEGSKRLYQLRWVDYKSIFQTEKFPFFLLGFLVVSFVLSPGRKCVRLYAQFITAPSTIHQLPLYYFFDFNSFSV